MIAAPSPSKPRECFSVVSDEIAVIVLGFAFFIEALVDAQWC